MQNIEDIRNAISSIVSFSRETLSIQDMMDEVKALKLICSKNSEKAGAKIFENLNDEFHFINRLLIHLRLLLISTGGAEKAVNENFKALVYATLEHVALRIGISASSQSTLTFFTNVISFLLNRVAEYSYVRSAKQSQEIYFSQARTYLWEDLWEIAEKNQSNSDVDYGKACEIKNMINSLINSIDIAKSEEVYIRLYSVMVYIYLLNILKIIDEK